MRWLRRTSEVWWWCISVEVGVWRIKLDIISSKRWDSLCLSPLWLEAMSCQLTIICIVVLLLAQTCCSLFFCFVLFFLLFVLSLLDDSDNVLFSFHRDQVLSLSVAAGYKVRKFIVLARVSFVVHGFNFTLVACCLHQVTTCKFSLKCSCLKLSKPLSCCVNCGSSPELCLFFIHLL